MSEATELWFVLQWVGLTAAPHLGGMLGAPQHRYTAPGAVAGLLCALVRWALTPQAPCMRTELGDVVKRRGATAGLVGLLHPQPMLAVNRRTAPMRQGRAPLDLAHWPSCLWITLGVPRSVFVQLPLVSA